MQIKSWNPRKSLNKAFLKLKPNRSEIENFKTNLQYLLSNINEDESEEFHKNLIIDFLKRTYYDPNFFINTKGRNDLVIHNKKEATSSVGVIIEAKKPSNRSEMITTYNINQKALHELILYYLRERISNNNLEIKHLIVTNINEWFIFDVKFFERNFVENKSFVEKFEDFENGRLSDTTTNFFYTQIAKPELDKIKDIEFTYFNIQDYKEPLLNSDKSDDNKLIALYKLLSPEHLLKIPFANDSNSLDRAFYSELLHIIGLVESRDAGKRIIERQKEGERNVESLIENAIIQLDALDKVRRMPNHTSYGSNYEEQTFNVALELAITWMNRILFLKLLEAQLINYHKGDTSYAFLNFDKIKNYDDLNRLFFQVLAKTKNERNEQIRAEFDKVPYLNSSLFETSDIEHNALFISNLEDERDLPIYAQTVLKDKNGKRISGKMSALEYLFQFLNAYDFSSEGSEEIQEDNKTLINASVLGLIFEKINGYKDGSFYTPGFITMYMARGTIRRAVVQKFNEVKNWNCKDFIDLHNKIEDIKEANEIINSIRICDPAVGSGHFLVSALNEFIAIKNDLKILHDREGRRLRNYHVEVVNDELVVTDEEGELFEYKHKDIESQRVQEALFHEKQTIIENCLFGVDINVNSVKICRLRLWIELLKNAYYKNEDDLETLPNIDINIKNGNSLISRFQLDSDLKAALRKAKYNIGTYREAVKIYRNADNKEQKYDAIRLIDDIKSDFRSEIAINDPKIVRLAKLKGDIFNLSQEGLFELDKENKAARKKKIENITKQVIKLEAEIEEIKNNKIYENAFEWRIEFPEILNDDGDFIGFDAIIGNPPYVQLQKMGSDSDALSKLNYETFARTGDIYSLFYELGVRILKPSGYLSYITSNKWMRAGYGESTRRFFAEKTNPLVLIDFGGVQIFESATVDTNILMMSKEKNQLKTMACVVKDEVLENLSDYVRQNASISSFNTSESWVILSKIEQRIKNKIEAVGTPLKDWDINIYRGILTGYNEAFIIDGNKKQEILDNCTTIEEREKTDELIRPLLRGRDIKKYSYNFDERYLIATFPSRNYNIDDFPAVKQFLIGFYPKIKQTGENLSNEEINAVMNHAKKEGIQINDNSLQKSRKRTTNKWFETQDSISYWEDFYKQKIIWKAVGRNLAFSISEEGTFLTAPASFITSNLNYYILAFLSSSFGRYYIYNNSDRTGAGDIMLNIQSLERIPIPEPTVENEKKINELISQILDYKQNGIKTDNIESEIDKLIYDVFEFNTEEIEFIETE